MDGELTAYENMEFHAVLYGLKKGFMKKTKALLKAFGLFEKRNFLVRAFSGGMKRRLEIARGYLSEDYVKEETEAIYMKWFCEPEEIAKAILFLASDDASIVIGMTLKVDGGHG